MDNTIKFPTTGNAEYEVFDDAGMLWLDINPAYKLLRIRCPNGDVHIGNTRDQVWRDNVLPSLVSPSALELLQRFFREAEFYYKDYFGPLFGEPEEEPELSIHDDPINLEYLGEEGKFSIDAYPHLELLHIKMPDSKFVWSSYAGVFSNRDLLEFIDEGLFNYLKRITGDKRINKQNNNIRIYREKLWGELPFALAVDPTKDFISVHFPARTVWTNSEKFYKDTRVLGAFPIIEKWLLEKLRDAGLNMDALREARTKDTARVLNDMNRTEK